MTQTHAVLRSRTDSPRTGCRRRKLFGAAGVTACRRRRRGRGRAGRPRVGGQHAHLAPAHAVPFRGERQAGIVTAAQDRMHFGTFDVTTDNRDDVVAMLKDGPRWPSG